MKKRVWTFPPELLARIINDVISGKITRHEGKQQIRDYLDEKYPDRRNMNKKKPKRQRMSATGTAPKKGTGNERAPEVLTEVEDGVVRH